MTAVEFLLQNIHLIHSTKWNNIIEQAKEMEKQQIINAYYYDPNCDEIKDDGEQYYNETYGKEG